MATPREQKSKGSWKKFKGRLQESWGALTGDELDRHKGQREQLEGHIHEKTGESRQNIRKKLDKMATEAKYKF